MAERQQAQGHVETTALAPSSHTPLTDGPVDRAEAKAQAARSPLLMPVSCGPADAHLIGTGHTASSCCLYASQQPPSSWQETLSTRDYKVNSLLLISLALSLPAIL